MRNALLPHGIIRRSEPLYIARLRETLAANDLRRGRPLRSEPEPETTLDSIEGEAEQQFDEWRNRRGFGDRKDKEIRPWATG